MSEEKKCEEKKEGEEELINVVFFMKPIANE